MPHNDIHNSTLNNSVIQRFLFLTMLGTLKCWIMLLLKFLVKCFQSNWPFDFFSLSNTSNTKIWHILILLLHCKSKFRYACYTIRVCVHVWVQVWMHMCDKCTKDSSCIYQVTTTLNTSGISVQVHYYMQNFDWKIPLRGKGSGSKRYQKRGTLPLPLLGF